MIRLHIDDLKHMMKHDHFVYLRRWLEQHDAIIVQPNDIRVPDNFMPGTCNSTRGRWGVDEPYPPFGGTRKLLEDAHNGQPPTSGESVPLV